MICINKGGKGLAAFGGTVLAYHPRMFLGLLVTGLILMPVSASVLFPVLVAVQSQSLAAVLVCTATSILLIAKHWSIFGRIRRGEDKKVRDFIRGK